MEFIDFNDEHNIERAERYLLAVAMSTHPTNYTVTDLLVSTVYLMIMYLFMIINVFWQIEVKCRCLWIYYTIQQCSAIYSAFCISSCISSSVQVSAGVACAFCFWWQFSYMPCFKSQHFACCLSSLHDAVIFVTAKKIEKSEVHWQSWFSWISYSRLKDISHRWCLHYCSGIFKYWCVWMMCFCHRIFFNNQLKMTIYVSPSVKRLELSWMFTEKHAMISRYSGFSVTHQS